MLNSSKQDLLLELASTQLPLNKIECPVELNQSKQYVDLGTVVYFILALITSIGFIVSLISNLIVIYIFTSTPSIRKNSSNIIAVNLSLSDLLYCTQWPSEIYCSLTQSAWILDYHLVCQSFGFITVCTAAASIMTILTMSIERVLVIMFSFRVRNRFTNRRARLIVVLIWMLAIVSALPPLFGKFNQYTLDPKKTSCTIDYLSRKRDYKLYTFLLCAAYYILPTIIITICYALIIITFKKSSLDLRKVADEGHKVKHHTKSSFRCREIDDLDQSTVDLETELPARKLYDPESNRDRSIDSIGKSSQCAGRTESVEVEANKHLSSETILAPQRLKLNVSIGVYPEGTNSKASNHFIFRGVSNCTRRSYSNYKQQFSSRSVRSSLQNDMHSDSQVEKFKSIEQRHPKLSTNSNSSSTTNSQPNRAVLQFRLAKMSFYLILLWLASWTPLASISIINSIVKCYRASATAVFMCSAMKLLGPALDVFIYGISHPKIKRKFKQTIRRLFMLKDSGTHQQRESTNYRVYSTNKSTSIELI